MTSDQSEVAGRLLKLRPPYLLFLGRVKSESDAKTAFGLRDWARDACLGQFRLPDCAVDLGLPDLTPAQAAALGAGSLVVGIAPPGGAIAPEWIGPLADALRAGLDVVSGLHQRLAAVPELAEAAHVGVRLIDIRHPSRAFGVGAGIERPGKRLLTVGTDCAIGKKYAALAIHAELRRRGRDTTFRATGQTGILIAGGGVAVDAVVADFIAGAAEALSPAADPAHWDVIEGQGSLFHPSYAGVSLGLLHGSQPDAIVMCHDPARAHIEDMPHLGLPTLDVAIARNLEAAWLTNPGARCVGISLNTSRLSDYQSAAVIEETGRQIGLPVCDPMRGGVGAIIDALA